MNAKHKNPRRRQNLAYLLGACLGVAVLVFNLLPAGEPFHAKGPLNVGHASLSCNTCHQDAPGSFRQQIQANLRYALGQRDALVDFGRKPVSNETCLGCHERPNDRHPVYRFLEPRFVHARQKLRPHECASCHAEHHGKRVTLTDVGYCVECHKGTKLKKDPIDIPHATLVADQRWDTCLGCHDFHGNHIMPTGKTVDKAIPPETIRAYFDGGKSPYGDARHYKAKKEAENG